MASKTTDDIQDMCSLCNETITIYAVGDCDHPICYKCSARMRVLCDQNYCAICRQDMNMVLFTKKCHKFDNLRTRSGPADRRSGIYFESSSIQSAYYQLLELQCQLCEKLRPFQNFNHLKNHLRKEHNLFYCDLCVDHLKIFPYERRCYDRKKLAEHRRVGDEDGGHRGHPNCDFCDVRYLDNDELARHLRKDHYYCHFCDTDGISNKFYGDYDFLRTHFEEQHYLCEEGECARIQFTNAFRSDIDYQAHCANTHGKGLKKSAARQVRTIDIDINHARPGRRGPPPRRDQQEYLRDGDSDHAHPDGRRRKDRTERARERQEDRDARAVSAALTQIQSQGHVNLVDPSLIQGAIKDVPYERSNTFDANAADFPTLDGQVSKGENSSDGEEKSHDGRPSSLAKKLATVNRLSVQNGSLGEADFPSLKGETTQNVPQSKPQSRTAWEYNATSTSDFPTLGGKRSDSRQQQKDANWAPAAKFKKGSSSGGQSEKQPSNTNTDRPPSSKIERRPDKKSERRKNERQPTLQENNDRPFRSKPVAIVDDFPSLSVGTDRSLSSKIERQPDRKTERSRNERQHVVQEKHQRPSSSKPDVQILDDFPSLSSIGDSLFKRKGTSHVVPTPHTAKKQSVTKPSHQQNSKSAASHTTNSEEPKKMDMGLKASKSSPDFSTYTSGDVEHVSKVQVVKQLLSDNTSKPTRQPAKNVNLKKSDFPVLGSTAKADNPSKVSWGPSSKHKAKDSVPVCNRPAQDTHLMKMKVKKNKQLEKPDILLSDSNDSIEPQLSTSGQNSEAMKTSKSKKQGKLEKPVKETSETVRPKKKEVVKHVTSKETKKDKSRQKTSPEVPDEDGFNLYKENIIPETVLTKSEIKPEISVNSSVGNAKFTEKVLDINTFPSWSENQDSDLSQLVLQSTSLPLSNEDFPSLDNPVVSAPKAHAPPPGFSAAPIKKAAEWKPAPPPGFQSTPVDTVLPGYEIPQCTKTATVAETLLYLQPTNFQVRNKDLIKQIHRLLDDDNDKFMKFKMWSGEYRQKKMSAADYYSNCSNMLGQSNFLQVFPELLVLLPDIEMQQELLATHVKSRKNRGGSKEPWNNVGDAFSTCLTCSQVLCRADVKEHTQKHGLDTDYPTLGAPSGRGIAGIGTWKIK